MTAWIVSWANARRSTGARSPSATATAFVTPPRIAVLSPPTWPAPISPRPASVSTTISLRAARCALAPEPANPISSTCCVSALARACARIQRAVTVNSRRRSTPMSRKRAGLARRRTHPPARIPARRRLSLLRAAQARAAGLYGKQKAVEMGVRRLRPVITRRTQVARVNLEERLAANSARSGGTMRRDLAARHRGGGSVSRTSALARWPPERRLLIFCDEDAPLPPIRSLLRRRSRRPRPASGC